MPVVRAVAIPAGVISVASSVAAIAFFEMATESRGAADLDGSHNAQLLKGKLVSFPVGRALLPENVGHFESGPQHPGLFPELLFRLTPQPVERADGGGDDV